MRQKLSILLLPFMLFFFSSCEDESSIVDATAIEQTNVVIDDVSIGPREPSFNVQLDFPDFPTNVLHILQVEYENQVSKNGVTQLEYLEGRLLALYPEVAYQGMFTSYQEELNSYKEAYSQYMEELRIYNEKHGIVNEEEETIDWNFATEDWEQLQLTEEEMKEFVYLNNIAKSSKGLTKEDLEGLTKRSSERVTIAPIFANIGVIAAGLGYSGAIAILSRDRAENKENEFYPQRENTGDNADAFFHMFISMHLKRYLTGAGSKAIMDLVEAQGGNAPRDREMDLHNNRVGRVNRYSSFRGSYFSSWSSWASNVRNFVNGIATNGIPMDRLHDWRNNPPTTNGQAASDINSEPNDENRYVYWNGTTRSVPLCFMVFCIQGYTCNPSTGNCEVDPNFDNCDNCLPGEECINGICRPF